MRPRLLFPALVLFLALLACNFPVATPPVTETPTLFLFTPSATLSLPTVGPTITPLPTNTVPPPPTSTVPIVSPNGINVNCRLGPGTAWVPLERAGRRANGADHRPVRRQYLVAGQRSPQSGTGLLGGRQRGRHGRQPVRNRGGAEPDRHGDQCNRQHRPEGCQHTGLHRHRPGHQDQRDDRDKWADRGKVAIRNSAGRRHAHADHNVRYLWGNGILRRLHAGDCGRDLLGQTGRPQPEQHPGREQLSDRLSVISLLLSQSNAAGDGGVS